MGGLLTKITPCRRNEATIRTVLPVCSKTDHWTNDDWMVWLRFSWSNAKQAEDAVGP